MKPLKKLIRVLRHTFIQSKKGYLLIIILICTLFLIVSYVLSKEAEKKYASLISVIIYDRNRIPISIAENPKGHYVIPIKQLPDSFVQLLLAKEDQLFFYHVGFNPYSILRSLGHTIGNDTSGGMSTLTEQLAKNILYHENDRTFFHKVSELIYALSMEIFLSKEEILTMYANTVYLGNQVQGFETASHAYFKKNFSETTIHEQISLLATLSYPTSRNPWGDDNESYARALSLQLHVKESYRPPQIEKSYSLQDPMRFELQTLGITCTSTCHTTLDVNLTQTVRTFLHRIVEKERARGVRTGAIVVIDSRNNELLAVVGSPNPESTQSGNQINMAIVPRPIGSTIKPFIYVKGFEEGLRPYTIVNDREYRYPIASGFSLYPKNFDGSYHGEITLHYALLNSLNVPSVKVLEYIGLPKFYDFLENKLAFTSIQPLASYQYGIALGGLEMDLLTLTNYFTIFPNHGVLAPLHILKGQTFATPQSSITEAITVVQRPYADLVTTLLTDRFTGVEQFGLESTLNLSTHEYAVKTGTSRDFHDSWVVGYTPDFVVGVWLGNSENEALEQVSGQSGAGAVWHMAMEYLLASSYNSKRSFEHSGVQTFPLDDSVEWGLKNDTPLDHMHLLTDANIITSIHEGDVFAYGPTSIIPLKAKRSVIWTVNGSVLGEGQEVAFTPTRRGKYEIQASYGTEREIVHIEVTEPD